MNEHRRFENPLDLPSPTLQDSCNHELFLKSVAGLDLSLEPEINARLFLANFHIARSELSGLYMGLYVQTKEISFKERVDQLRNTTPISLSGWVHMAARDLEVGIAGISPADIETQADIAQMASNIFVARSRPGSAR